MNLSHPLVLPLVLMVCLLTQASSAQGPAQEEAKETRSTLEGTLRVHPKFLFKQYLNGFGDGQQCALFGQEQLEQIEPGTHIRVTGRLGTRFHPGGSKDNPSPFPRTWYIYMKVESVTILRKPTPNRRPAERLRPPREVVVGMTLAQVIAARGRHYKPFAGPRVGQVALVYDDITIHIMGNTRPEFDGRVVAIETTDKEKAAVFVKDIPYADEQPGEPKEAPKLPADRTLKSHANEVQLPFAKKQSDRQDNAVRPGPGLLGRTFLEGKEVGFFFRYEHGKVFRHELVERKFIQKRDEKLPPKGVEVVLQGRLLVPRKMSATARHAGGSVSHGVQTIFVDGKELGSVGG